jgi:serine/threonine-protein kinase
VSHDPFGLVGKVIAEKLRVERVLGEGGFGVVYAGTHLVLGLPIAIKCLKTGDAGAFLREARILFTLSHPAIVRLFDAGVVAELGIPYAALELLSGSTLAEDIAARAPLRRHYGRDELASIFGSILEGVAFAHERGIIHRDLKPANIMLVSDGGRVQPKVLDFGTARATALDGIVATGASLSPSFTPLYASPEQWERSRGEVSPRTDVYALGLTFAEMCLLAHPFPTPDNLAAIMRDTFDESRRTRIVAARPDLPAELDAAIVRATRVRPDERQANARELLIELRSALETSPHTAPLARPLTRPSAPAPTPLSIPPGAPLVVPPNAAIVAAPTGTPTRSGTRLPWVLTAIFLFITVIAMVAGIVAAVRLAQPKSSPAEAHPDP